MEMPCMCDCGKWFDLHDGFTSKKYNSNKVICKFCYLKQIELEREIEKLESEADELEYLNKKPKRVEKLNKKATELKERLYY